MTTRADRLAEIEQLLDQCRDDEPGFVAHVRWLIVQVRELQQQVSDLSVAAQILENRLDEEFRVRR